MKLEKILVIATFIMIVTVAVWAALRPDLIPRFNLVLLAGLIAVTTVYAYSTIKIARHSEKQAEEMKEQRVTASRPVIIQGAVYKESGLTGSQIQWLGTEESDISYFSHFEMYNAGNGPAIDIEISLLNKKKAPLDCVRKTFLRTNDPPIKFYLPDIANLEESMTHYLLCEYKSILSRKTWYQTWLSFSPTESGKGDELLISVVDTLEFKEVTEEKRIDAFSRLTHSVERVSQND